MTGEHKYKTVCWIGYASQPSMQFKCDEMWSTPDWNQPELPKGVHLAENGRLYAFSHGPVDCVKCLKAEFRRLDEETAQRVKERLAKR